MKVLVRTMACLFVLILIQGFTSKEEAMSGEQKEMSGGETQEETLIEKKIIDRANAIPIKPHTVRFPLEEANRALQALKSGSTQGAAVLSISAGRWQTGPPAMGH